MKTLKKSNNSVKILAPIALCIQFLYKNNADLLSAEKVTEFIAKKLRDIATISLSL